MGSLSTSNIITMLVTIKPSICKGRVTCLIYPGYSPTNLVYLTPTLPTNKNQTRQTRYETMNETHPLDSRTSSIESDIERTLSNEPYRVFNIFKDVSKIYLLYLLTYNQRTIDLPLVQSHNLLPPNPPGGRISPNTQSSLPHPPNPVLQTPSISSRFVWSVSRRQQQQQHRQHRQCHPPTRQRQIQRRRGTIFSPRRSRDLPQPQHRNRTHRTSLSVSLPRNDPHNLHNPRKPRPHLPHHPHQSVSPATPTDSNVLLERDESGTIPRPG